ncbi:MAG TPA: HAD domain-containing protein [Solirubrobacteraceae bacterium]|jgi:hypothetical protein|nr:HAD domain-containing protein [Solirubrobacteraceae bacterium]
MGERDAPLLFVDVDGVLNCFGEKDSLPPLEAEFRALRYTIRVPEGTSARVARLQRAFACVWATTWEHFAFVALGEPLGLSEQWPVVELLSDDNGGTRKLADIIAFAGERPCAWIDDELQDDADEWASGRQAAGIPTLLVRTVADVGLTEEQTQQLLDWAAAFAEGA